MNNQKKTIWWIILFIAALFIVYGVYQFLGGQYQGDGIAGQQSEETVAALDFVMEDQEGNEVMLMEYIGEKPVVLNFWASWCGPCKMEFPDFQKVYQELGDEVNFVLVNLTTSQNESKEKAEKFISDGSYTLPVYFDHTGAGAYTYGIRSIPTTYIINTEGRSEERRVGKEC